jgi:hypothetical protein
MQVLEGLMWGDPGCLGAARFFSPLVYFHLLSAWITKTKIGYASCLVECRRTVNEESMRSGDAIDCYAVNICDGGQEGRDGREEGIERKH